MQIRSIEKIEKDILPLIGGKARGLAILKENEFRIPRTYVISDFSNGYDLDAIVEVWNSMDNCPLAIRSSASLEDGTLLSSAGQYATVLDVLTKEDLVKALDLCLESLNSKTIEKYREIFLQGKSEMNIVMQEMVDCSKAGVVFSVNPKTKAEEVFIGVVEGKGDALVSGTASSVDVLIKKTNPEFAENNLITIVEQQILFDCAVYMEKVFDSPVDIEYGIDTKGEVYFLQVRPITTLDDPDISELNTKYKVDNDVLTNHNVGEMLPGAITPLTISTVVYAIDFGLREMLSKVGVAKSISEIPEELLVSHYYNHLFFNMKYLYRIEKCVMAAGKQNVDIGLCGRIIELEQPDDYPEKSSFAKTINGIKYFSYMLSKNKAIKKIAKVPGKVSFNYESIEKLYDSITFNQKHLNESLSLHYITSTHSGAMASAIFTILSIENDDHNEIKSQMSNVLANVQEIESADILASLKLLVRALKIEDPEIDKYTSNEIMDKILESDGKVKQLYNDFITKHGHRGLKESELRIPGYKDDLEDLGKLIKNLIPVVDLQNNEIVGNEKESIAKMLTPFKGLKKTILKYLIKEARSGCKSREFSKSRMIMTVDKFKCAYRELSKMLVDKGYLPDIDLIYFLTHQELGRLIKNKESSLIKKATIRRRLFAEQEQLSFEHVYQGAPVPFDTSKMFAEKGELLQGTSLSAGTIQGIARIVNHIDDANRLQKGDIMVAASTDIGYSPYYAIIGGLVTEVGSALSHGAVVAREYALPLVSNINFATSKIKDGDLVYLDGNKGTVIILEN